VRALGQAVGEHIAGLGKRVLILGTGGLSHEPPVPVIADAHDDIRNFLIAGRNPSAETRAARQARVLAAAKIYGGPDCDLTPLDPEWDTRFIDLLVNGRLTEVDDFNLEEIAKTAGRSANEIRTWIAAFSALAAIGRYSARRDYYRPINEWIAGYGAVSAEIAKGA
jgi:2,3-dihydroxyphenylpropionate 1,2-dioxygenase